MVPVNPNNTMHPSIPLAAIAKAPGACMHFLLWRFCKGLISAQIWPRFGARKPFCASLDSTSHLSVAARTCSNPGGVLPVFLLAWNSLGEICKEWCQCHDLWRPHGCTKHMLWIQHHSHHCQVNSVPYLHSFLCFLWGMVQW